MKTKPVKEAKKQPVGLSIICPVCDAAPGVYCRQWSGARWVEYRPLHIHRVRRDTETIKGSEPRLTWEKRSFKRYSAIVPGCGAHLEVLRSGRAGKMNERWHPAVFGNRWAGPSDGFETVVQAMVFAETTAIAYARATLEALR